MADRNGATDGMTTEHATSDEPVVVQSAPHTLPRFAHPHAQKFRVALAVLFGVAFAAVAIAVAVAVNSGGRTTVAGNGHWSSWSPTTTGSGAVSEIADHIAPYYRVSASQQLNVITPISVSDSTSAGTTTGSGVTVAVNASTSGKGQSLQLLNGKTVAYDVCGLGPTRCQLPGTPSESRMLLMRREALELALYTFKYIGDSQNVLAVLPPGKTLSGKASTGTPLTVAVLFLRSELQPWLNVPLAKTLQQYPPVESELPVWSQSVEAGLVDQITGRGLFSSQIEALQEGGNVLVLSPLPPQ